MFSGALHSTQHLTKLVLGGRPKWDGNELAGSQDHQMVSSDLYSVIIVMWCSTESREFVGTFGKPNWFDNVCEEHTKCRNEVCVFDMTSFAKFEVEVSTSLNTTLNKTLKHSNITFTSYFTCLHKQGDGVLESMQMLCANNVDVPVGKIVYTGMLNERGGYETDCTVTRTGPNK